MTSNTITLTREEARWFVDAALSSMSNDDITPVLCAAQITVEGTVATILCTDRYRVTRATANVESTGDHTFLMPREAVVFMGKNINAFGRYSADEHRIRITTTGDAIAVSVSDSASIEKRNSVTWEGQVMPGSFPPVGQLVDKARDAADGKPGRINLSFLAATKVLGNDGWNAPLFKFTDNGDGNRQGPLLLTFPCRESRTAEVLIQPNASRS